MPEKTDLTRVIVGGFGYSGSSAIVDWLQEKPGCTVFPVEWDFFRQPDGLQDLRDALTMRVSNRRAYIALKRFMYLSVTMSKPAGKVFGRDFENLTYPGLEKDLLEFANSLIAVSIPSPVTAKWLEDHQIYQPNTEISGIFPALTASMLRKIGRSKSQIRKRFLTKLLDLMDSRPMSSDFDELAPKDILLPYPMTTDTFDALARKQFDKITRKMARQASTHLVLDQGFSCAGAKDGLGLMSHTKAIYVHRDPRDVYLSSVTRKLDWIPVNSVEEFSNWFKITMPKADMDDPRIKVIAFEDLVHKPDEVLNHLAEFLGIDNTPGPKHRTLFDPAISAKNSGKWRSYEDQDTMQRVWDVTQEHYQYMQNQTVSFDG